MKLTGWLILDPIVALAVATNIVWMAAKILLETAQGLLDRTIPAAEQKQLDDVLARFRGDGVEVHAVRARQSGPVRFIDMHVLVPGAGAFSGGTTSARESRAA